MRVSGLLGNFAAERDKSLRAAVDDIKGRNGLERQGVEGKRMRDGAFKVTPPYAHFLLRSSSFFA
jgi:hypothetical protein